MTDLLGSQALERRFRVIRDADTELHGVTGSVVHWVRTEDRQLLPIGAELVAPSPLLPDDVVVVGRFNEYGLDSDGHIVVARSRVLEDDELRVHEQITVERDGPRLWVIRFDVTIDRQVPLEMWTYPAALGPHPPVVEYVSRFAGYSVIEFDDRGPEDSEPVSSQTLAALLTQDLLEALRTHELCAQRWWLVWVHYTGEATHWIDAAWPTISAATPGDRAAVTTAAALHGWRAGWDTLDWTLPEHEVSLSQATQQALHGAAGSPEELDELMCSVVAALRNDDEHTTIYIAAAVDLERLVEAVKTLPPDQGRELRELGLVPGGIADGDLHGHA